MNKNLENIEKGGGLLEKFLHLIDKYGSWKMIKAFVLLIIFSTVVFMLTNPTYILEKYERMKEEQHTEMLEQRFELSNKVNSEIDILRNRTDATRAFIIEFHNSVQSVNGFPFAYGSCNFEVVADSAYYISDEYNHFCLSKYKLVDYLFKNQYFVGKVEDLKGIDDRMKLKFESNSIKYVALMLIEGPSLPVGILGVTFENSEGLDEKDIMSVMNKEIIRLGLIYGK